ncbi:MAG: hypothetical protein ACRCT8_04230 [Lacipirellulaceae bacterium]
MNASFAKTVSILTLLLGLAGAASASPAQQLYWLTGQIRGQMAAVEAQAHATFRGTGAGDDVFDELEDLCRDIDRLERELSLPIESRGALRRLARSADRINAQACELSESVEEEIARSGSQLGGGRPVGFPHGGGYGVGYGGGFDPRIGSPYGVPFGGDRLGGRGGVQVSLGGGRIVIGTGPTVVGRPVIGPAAFVGAPFHGGGHGPSCGRGVNPAQANALRAQVAGLQRLTEELHRILCG